MDDATAESRIRDLERRLAHDPESPLFVPLAEEYRRSGRAPDAIALLKRGLSRHPGYVSAQVALGRSLSDAGRIEEAIGMFSRALEGDPANPVSAKLLADAHLSRGENVEAIKKYKLYRALTGDRKMDEVIAGLQKRLDEAAAPVGKSAAPPAAASEPGGRTLADLYFAQGHYSEALTIYEELAAASPGDSELLARRYEAAALAARAGEKPASLPARTEAKIATLKDWLSRVQAR